MLLQNYTLIVMKIPIADIFGGGEDGGWGKTKS